MTAEERETLLAAIDEKVNELRNYYHDELYFSARRSVAGQVKGLEWTRALIEETKDDSHDEG